MTRIGLCLGAGGLVGQAYHAGVLAALQVDLGWDARTADLVVGTSAGAVTGAMLRLDTSPLDLAGWVIGRPWHPDHVVLEGFGAIRSALPALTARGLLRPWSLPALRTWLPDRYRPWAVRPLAILSTMVPAGATAMDRLIADHLDPTVAGDWPDGLWICAVRRANGRRVVFGQRADESVPLPKAVAASACIPGYFSPVVIEGQEFLDGGIHSPTNADLLASEPLDLAVVVSPMSGGAGPVDRAFRRFARRRLRREIGHLERRGTRVVLFEPDRAAVRAMGLNPMASEGIDQVLQAGFFEAGALLARPEVRELLSPMDPGR